MSKCSIIWQSVKALVRFIYWVLWRNHPVFVDVRDADGNRMHYGTFPNLKVGKEAVSVASKYPDFHIMYGTIKMGLAHGKPTYLTAEEWKDAIEQSRNEAFLWAEQCDEAMRLVMEKGDPWFA